MPTPVALDPQLATPLAAGVVALGLFIGAIMRGWASKPKTQDAQVVAVDAMLADKGVIGKLTRTLTSVAEGIENFEHSQTMRSRELVEAMDAVRRETCRATEEAERVAKEIGKARQQAQHDAANIRMGLEALPGAIARSVRAERETLTDPLAPKPPA